MNRDYAGFLTQNITGFRNHTTGTPHLHGLTGCTYEGANNYNPNASEENGSCVFVSFVTGNPYPACEWTPELGYYQAQGLYAAKCIGVNYGCTDPQAQNYNPSADQDWTLGDIWWTLLDENAGGQTLCNYITDAKGKKGERFNFRRVSGGNEYGFSSSGFQSNGFTKGAPTSQPYAASFANACGCGV